jgi:hypothetical protein
VEFFAVAAALIGLIVLMIVGVSRPGGRRVSRGPGAGATGAIYDMLNEDKRRAIEIIVEGRAEQTDPETADDVPEDQDSLGSRGSPPDSPFSNSKV